MIVGVTVGAIRASLEIYHGIRVKDVGYVKLNRSPDGLGQLEGVAWGLGERVGAEGLGPAVASLLV